MTPAQLQEIIAQASETETELNAAIYSTDDISEKLTFIETRSYFHRVKTALTDLLAFQNNEVKRPPVKNNAVELQEIKISLINLNKKFDRIINEVETLPDAEELVPIKDSITDSIIRLRLFIEGEDRKFNE